MNKKIILKTMLLFSGLVTVPILATSCGTNDNQNHYVFALSTPANLGDATKFVTDIQQTFNNLKNQSEYSDYKDLDDITISVTNVDDNKAKKDLIENGSADFAFLTSKIITQDNFYQQVNSKIQTLTTAFTFDKNINDEYVNGKFDDTNQTDNDPLRTIANEMQKASFGLNYEYPFSTWKDGENGEPADPPIYGWNGIRYNAFYDVNSLISGYRGMIFLSGTDEKINQAVDAWNSQDWESFRNLGIVVGDETSAGTYLLQEQLIKKHFNKDNNWTLAQDRKDNQEKYDLDSYGSSKTADPNYTIYFTDEGSFAWTHNDGKSADFSTEENGKIKILTSTNPAIYDVGVFSKNVDQKVADLLSESIVYLYKTNNNLYGEGLGYNGYQLIKDVEKEVITPMKLGLGI
ncbi:MAG: hypothetical protein K2J02_01870 [Malacoplasma sp.]|nr:hypothetical protein [Malacoplasma sp.]MDE6894103.1 hypothetical protein [Malacoplasma sp.]MDE7075547.1 hypothetical protein [Malacoplasma sp.]